MRYLLDTNILSEIRKPNANAHVMAWFNGIAEADLFLSVIVIGEVRRGVEIVRHRGDQSQARALEAWLEGIERTFHDRLVPITVEGAEEWGRLNVPNPVPPVDGLLAATAKVHGWTLVTRNATHVERTGVRLLNPFAPPGS